MLDDALEIGELVMVDASGEGHLVEWAEGWLQQVTCPQLLLLIEDALVILESSLLIRILKFEAEGERCLVRVTTAKVARPRRSRIPARSSLAVVMRVAWLCRSVALCLSIRTWTARERRKQTRREDINKNHFNTRRSSESEKQKYIGHLQGAGAHLKEK